MCRSTEVTFKLGQPQDPWLVSAHSGYEWPQQKFLKWLLPLEAFSLKVIGHAEPTSDCCVWIYLPRQYRRMDSWILLGRLVTLPHRRPGSGNRPDHRQERVSPKARSGQDRRS